MPERLERSDAHRVLAGVCGGIADHYVLSPGFVRGVFLLATLFTGGMFVFVYLLLAFLLPAPAKESSHA